MLVFPGVCEISILEKAFAKASPTDKNSELLHCLLFVVQLIHKGQAATA